MPKLSHYIALMILIGCLTACTGKDGTFDVSKPYSLDLTPPEGPFEYTEGWSDGCESGMSAYGNNFYKLLKAHQLKMNPELRKNRMYYQAWKDAFLYCAVYLEAVNSDPL